MPNSVNKILLAIFVYQGAFVMNYNKILYYLMMGFGFVSFITLAGGNVLLGIATLFFLIYMYKHRDSVAVPLELKQFGYVIGFFLLTMLLSALFSGDLAKGLKNWADLWIWRMMPFVIMVLALNEEDKAKHNGEDFREDTNALEEEAIRIARLTSGKWSPGEQDGQKVRVKFSLPITFRLN